MNKILLIILTGILMTGCGAFNKNKLDITAEANIKRVYVLPEESYCLTDDEIDKIIKEYEQESLKTGFKAYYALGLEGWAQLKICRGLKDIDNAWFKRNKDSLIK